MALYIPHSIFHLARLFYVRPETLDPPSYYKEKRRSSYVVASKEIGLEVNADKSRYMVMFRDQDAVKSHGINIDNISFERVKELSNILEQS